MNRRPFTVNRINSIHLSKKLPDMKLLYTIVICSFFQFQTIAQDQNLLFTNVSYAFFGTGDLSGTAIGLDYHRSIWNRLGVHLGFSKATGKGDNTLRQIGENNQNAITNITFTGDGDHVSDLANYTTALLGINYKVVDQTGQVLLVNTGLNYKQFQYNYLAGYLAENINGQGVAEQITIQSTALVADKETGIYFGLDYLYVLNNSLTIGIHGVVENSSNILSKAGLSIGYRF